jgi:hypothetical protein
LPNNKQKSGHVEFLGQLPCAWKKSINIKWLRRLGFTRSRQCEPSTGSHIDS